MTRRQPMTLQLQQQWRKDGEKSDEQAAVSPRDAEATTKHASDSDQVANHEPLEPCYSRRVSAIPLDDPVVRKLLEEPNLARLAYIGENGRPRVVPIWFAHIDGDIIMVTGPRAEKARALAKNPAVALTIDSATPPYNVLLVDGDAALEPVEGMAPEYRPIVERYLGQLLPRVKRQVRIRVRPTSWRIFDFVKRYPKSLR